MGVFALHQGRLVAAAQTVPSEVSAGLLDAVRSQVLEFIGQPLFGVGWADQTFLALDITGQVVSIDVVERLSVRDFSAALARAGSHAQMSRAALGQMYPGGLDSFDADFRAFIDSAPPRTSPGSRLHIFSLSYDADVLRPIHALRGGGVEAHRVVGYQSAQGLLVEIAELADLPVELPWSGETPVVEVEASEGKASEGEADQVECEARVAGPEPSEVPEPTAAEAESPADEPTAPAPADSPAPAPAEPPLAAEALVDRAHRYDDAWDISGWRYEKERPAKRSASEVLSTAESLRSSRESRRALSEDALSLLEKNRRDVGPTMYDQLLSESKRPEQRLWDMSAPKEHGATIFSEHVSSAASQEAVTRAAMHPWQAPAPAPKPAAAPAAAPVAVPGPADSHPEPLPRMRRVVAEVGAVVVTWRSRRRRRHIDARLTEAGLLVVEGVGIFADPSEAAVAASGMIGADGWRMWLAPDGRSLGDIA
ncbi:hypothetical protein [Trueperella abortisuis]|uniref:RAMA domain-containing protein n=1 Tax=Trueperella abortisuis TaxID=445930 RepID=A0ABT9PKD8_9ACTO|nr:hypothetical protein [Trueperella abortisuis]MDP9833163.1 hypothetical protein [Trueperella abortisuis]